TTLLIPGLNDSEAEVARECDWILANLGDEVPLHFSAFHPTHKLVDVPRTPQATLARCRELALRAGLKFVYCGNVQDEEAQTTYCPGCGTPLVRRVWHSVRTNALANASASAFTGARTGASTGASTSARASALNRRSVCKCGRVIPGRFGCPSTRTGEWL
ncbi:MAG: AmmeMemoRadiSam system radical SAM enzyme, partial [Pseudomonadota bacterium]